MAIFRSSHYLSRKRHAGDTHGEHEHPLVELLKLIKVQLMDVFRIFVNELFKESFNTTFMKNINSCKKSYFLFNHFLCNCKTMNGNKLLMRNAEKKRSL